MKAKLLTTLLICFFANLLTAQTLVKPADFSFSAAAEVLKSKGYTILEKEETYIKIADKSKATLFIDIDKDKKYLLFNINILLNKNAAKDKIDTLITEINHLGMIKSAHLADKNAISFQYYFWITGGFTNETLEDAVMEFFLYQGDAYGLDKDKVINYE
ncbi:hypothetical protein M2347_001265 [Chryseobacterium sp. H1D6B]|uniref:hypothetical protein n=1 Tax=Chryseobacterium sp. H1D6B TaxID=2940588 RepID=UPI0015CA2F76|nr:hypothetical protein [Chryseobacterium sp. H1D6B]MDH6251538.1 hypothetical protein [Chryseobacterium sp. H1D6B]